MTIDQIKKNAPEGAQYYHSQNFMYYMGVVNDFYFWSATDCKWVLSSLFIEDVWRIKPIN